MHPAGFARSDFAPQYSSHARAVRCVPEGFAGEVEMLTFRPSGRHSFESQCRRVRKTADRTIRGPRNAVDFAAGWSGKKAPGLARHIGHTQLIAAHDAVIIFVGGTGRFGSLVSLDEAVNCGTLFDDARNGCRYQQPRGQAIRTRGVIRRAQCRSVGLIWIKQSCGQPTSQQSIA